MRHSFVERRNGGVERRRKTGQHRIRTDLSDFGRNNSDDVWGELNLSELREFE